MLDGFNKIVNTLFPSQTTKCILTQSYLAIFHYLSISLSLHLALDHPLYLSLSLSIYHLLSIYLSIYLLTICSIFNNIMHYPHSHICITITCQSQWDMHTVDSQTQFLQQHRHGNQEHTTHSGCPWCYVGSPEQNKTSQSFPCSLLQIHCVEFELLFIFWILFHTQQRNI